MADDPQTGKAGVKLAADIGPVILFFATYQAFKMKGDMIRDGLGLGVWWEPIYAATAVFIPATLIGLAVGFWTFRKLSPMPVITAVIVLIFGGLTLALHNEVFIYMKTTVINGVFAALLLTASAFRKLPFKYLFRDAFALDDEGWAKLQWRWALFFAFLGGLNEFFWRVLGEEAWVNYKTWGVFPLTLAFGLAMAVTVGRAHALYAGDASSDETGKPDSRHGAPSGGVK